MSDLSFNEMFKETKAVGGGVGTKLGRGNYDISGRLNVAGYLPGYHALCLGIRLDTMQFGWVPAWVPPCLGTTMPGYHAMPNVKLHPKFNSISMHFSPLLSLSHPPSPLSIRVLCEPVDYFIPNPLLLLLLPPLLSTFFLSPPPPISCY